MKKIAIVMLMLLSLFAGTLCAQDKPPQVSEKAKLAIRDAQVEYLQMQQQVQQVNQALQAAQAKLLAAVDAAFVDAKVKKEDYDLGNDLNLVKKAEPPKPAEAAKPEAKPAAKK